MQNEIKGVLERMSAGATKMIFNSANPRDKSLTEGYARCSGDVRAHSERDERAQVPQWKPVCRRV